MFYFGDVLGKEKRGKPGREAENVISESRQMFPFISHRLAAGWACVKQGYKRRGAHRGSSLERLET